MKRGLVYLAAYIGTIFAANWAITHFGFVPVGCGLSAPAGVYFVGLAFTLRDLAQDRLGTPAIMAAIIVGAGLSAFLSPSLALASGVAFLLSEGADLVVYTPLRRRHWLAAVALSNIVGLLFDSVLFLWLAFHSEAYLPGQVLGKFWMTVLAVAVLSAGRKVFPHDLAFRGGAP